MPSFLLFLPILFFSMFSVPVFAQESAFGDLSGAPKTDRTVFTTDGLTLDSYLEVKLKYEDLESLHERSFGTRKTDIANQMLARAMDVLVSKLGATSTFLFDLQSNVGGLGVVSEEGMSYLETVKNSYESLVPDFVSAVEAGTSIEELSDLSKTINTTVLAKIFVDVSPQMAVLAVARGEQVIKIADEKAPILQAHINASGDLGGAIENVQKTFNNSMLSLEEARDGYKEIGDLVGDASSYDLEQRNPLKSKVRSAVRNTRKGYDGLESVMDQLRALYSQSPWEIDSAQFESMEVEHAMMEDTEGMEVEDVAMEDVESSVQGEE